MGQLCHKHKYIKTTKQIESTIPLKESLDVSSSQEPSNPRTNIMYVNMKYTYDIYSDQTGKFPLQSSRGHNYVFILYDYDSNAIMTVPLKKQQAKSMAEA